LQNIASPQRVLGGINWVA
jgi:hypothetical protein